jgi:DNA topoisomerase-2
MKELKTQVIKKLSEREHILQKSGMYLGSSTLTKSKEYIIANTINIPDENGNCGTSGCDVDYFKETEIEYVPGLVKIFNELIDNTIDEYVRTNGQFANKIDIELTDEKFCIQDNGRGIPVTEVQAPEGTFYQPELAWTHARAGSNFEDSNSTTIGSYGVGSMIASVFAKEFIGISNDGNLKCTVKCQDNNSMIDTKISKPKGKQGVRVEMIPDVERFGLKSITQPHIDMIKQRLYNLSVSYPEITFKLNNERIKLKAKDFLKMFNTEGTIIEEDKFSIGVFPSDTDDFKQFTLMNGLNLTAGGTHMEHISTTVVRIMRDKIIKKYKSIKPADIKRKLFVVCIMKDFKGPKYETQTKEKLTNPMKDIQEYFKDLDLEKLADKVYKNKAITDGIIDYFRIQEEYKKKKELKGLEKTKKKIKSEKYTKAIGRPKVLFITEGDSASGSVSKILGRNGYAYYSLKGKPLNAYSASQSKFTSNKELSELYQIIKSEEWETIAITTDSDLDGISINGLLLAFLYKYLPNLLKEDKVFRFQTPVAVQQKNKKTTDWVYDFNNISTLDKPGYTVKYLKGLGSLTPEILEKVIDKDTFESMLLPLTYTEETAKSIDDWYSNSKTDIRKEKIQENKFSIVKL